MFNFLSRIVAILGSISALLLGHISAPVQNIPTPTPSEISISTDAPAPVETIVPASTPIPTPDIKEIVDQVEQLKKDILAYTPEPTPTPEIVIVYVTPAPQVAQAAAPTPTPQVSPAKVASVDFPHKVQAEPGDAIVTIKTDNPAKILFSYVVDDGSIMASYDSGSKDNDRLSAVVAAYAVDHSKTIVTDLDTRAQIKASDLEPGRIFFSIQAENATGQTSQYTHYGNIWDWNDSVVLELQ